MADRWSGLEETEPGEGDCRMGRIHGLKARADLNGRIARAIKFLQGKQRWALVVDGGEKVLVKSENIDFGFAAQKEGDIAEQQPTPVRAIGRPVLAGRAVEEVDSSLAVRVAPDGLSFLQCICLPFAPRDQ